MTMSADKIDQIFWEALQLSSDEERQAYLDRACGGDQELRRLVEKLLRAQHKAAFFLEEPFAPGDAPVHEGPGTVIGPYKLLEQIGEGGFGVVFMAEQTQPVQRLVALKIIKPGMDSRQVIARFEQERQALALMDHPNIAKVLDAGTIADGRLQMADLQSEISNLQSEIAAGRPYFVMELVKGIPITRYCDDFNLTPRERLELFLPVCHAVQHAHQKGIIHRDLKPSNVLVALYDDKPVPKIIDFGVAKATGPKLVERTMFTQFGQLVGTLEYMSPEQASFNALDIDTRSDIYSLGVLLYELLTGSTPFERKRLHQAAFDEMLRIIREEEPPRPSTRLSTAEELPAIAARRRTEAARLGRLVRGDLDWIVMKALEKDRARRYETANGLARDIENYLHDEPVQACPPSASYRLRKFVRRNQRGLAMLSVLGLLILGAVGAVAATIGWAARNREALREEVARDQAERQARREEVWPGVRQWQADLAMVARLEEIRLEQAAVQDERFDLARADPAYRVAFQQYGLDIETLDADKAAAGIQASAIRDSLLAVLDDWMLVKWLGRLPGVGQLLAVVRRADADPWRDRFRAALERWDGKALRDLLADENVLSQPPATVRLLSITLYATRQPECAIDMLQQAQQRYPNDFWINHQLGLYLLRTKPPRAAEALGFLRAAVALRPGSPGARLNLGKALLAFKMPDEALVAFEEASRLKPNYATAWKNIGAALCDPKRDFEGSISATRKALSLRPDDPELHYNLGLALFRQGKMKEAEDALRESLRQKPDFVLPRRTLGVILCDFRRDYDGAIEVFQEALRIDANDAATHYNLGTAYAGKGKYDRAETEFREALRLDGDYAGAHSSLGAVYIHLNKWTEAEAEIREALRLDPKQPVAHQNLGVILDSRQDFDGAIPCYREALRLRPGFVDALCNLGRDLRKQDKPAEAVTPLREAVRLKPDHLTSLIELAWLLTVSSDLSVRSPQEALETARKAVERAPRSDRTWLVLGAARYRLGDWKISIAALEKSLSLQKSPALGYAGSKFLLAMACWQAGKQEEARKWYAQGMQQLDPRLADNSPERRLQAEAASLLGVNELPDGTRKMN